MRLWGLLVTGLAALLVPGAAAAASAAGQQGCAPPQTNREAAPAAIASFFEQQRRPVLTFLGYSGAGYEDRAAMITQAAAVLATLDPAATIVNIGATVDGIGAVYEMAKARGFTTSGIVSTQARDSKATISPCVDHVFFVRDSTWGGRLPGQDRLSPTSAAMVAVSSRLVAIGGGDVARDELLAARAAGKPVQFIPADMNHQIARERALRRKQPAPADFRGSAAAAFEALKK